MLTPHCLPLAELWLGQEPPFHSSCLPTNHALPTLRWLRWEGFQPQFQGWIMTALSPSSWLWLVSEWALDQVPPSIVRGYLFRNFWERSPCSYESDSLRHHLWCCLWMQVWGMDLLPPFRDHDGQDSCCKMQPEWRDLGHWWDHWTAELANSETGLNSVFPVL